MGRIYIVQNQHKMDQRTNQLAPKFDFSSAVEYGDLVYLLSPTARPFSPDHAIKVLRSKLKNYCDDDYLLLVGNPVLIGYTVAIAADYNEGRVNVLQWSGGKRQYIPIRADLLFLDQDEDEKEDFAREWQQSG